MMLLSKGWKWCGEVWCEWLKVNLEGTYGKIDGGSIAASRVVGSVHKMDFEEIQCAMNNMINEEASGLFKVVLEMLKAGWGPCLNSSTAIFNDILFESKLP